MIKSLNLIRLLVIFTSVTAIFLIASSFNNPQGSALCECEADWFPHSQTPPPKEGPDSPFADDGGENCDFHQWSWQKFLWLTKPLQSGNPLFADSLYLVKNDMSLVNGGMGGPLILEYTQQAGSSGILTSNANYGSQTESNTVYYSIYVNDTFRNEAQNYAFNILVDTLNLDNEWVFSVGALEVKASWIDTSSIPSNNRSDYYISDANVGGRETQVALLGMHVVGVVENHPEFIWATFEHEDMAPYSNWRSAATTDTVTSRTEKLLFSQGYHATVQNLQWDSSPQGMSNVFSMYEYGVPKVLGNTFMRGTSQNGLQNYTNIVTINSCVKDSLDKENGPWKNYFYNGSIWINTAGLDTLEQAETIDSLGYNIGNATTGSFARGSLANFNITMETFVQTFSEDPKFSIADSMNVNNLVNCFSCHNAPANIVAGDQTTYTSPLYISHVFRNYLGSQLGQSFETNMALRIQEHKNLIKKR